MLTACYTKRSTPHSYECYGAHGRFQPSFLGDGCGATQIPVGPAPYPPVRVIVTEASCCSRGPECPPTVKERTSKKQRDVTDRQSHARSTPGGSPFWGSCSRETPAPAPGEPVPRCCVHTGSQCDCHSWTRDASWETTVRGLPLTSGSRSLSPNTAPPEREPAGS